MQLIISTRGIFVKRDDTSKENISVLVAFDCFCGAVKLSFGLQNSIHLCGVSKMMQSNNLARLSVCTYLFENVLVDVFFSWHFVTYQSIFGDSLRWVAILD